MKKLMMVAAVLGLGGLFAADQSGVWMKTSDENTDAKAPLFPERSYWRGDCVAIGGLADFSQYKYWGTSRTLKAVLLNKDATVGAMNFRVFPAMPRFCRTNDTARLIFKAPGVLDVANDYGVYTTGQTDHQRGLTNGVHFALPVVAADSSVVFTKKGGSMARFNYPLTGFAKVCVKGGTLAGQMTSGTFLSDAPVEVEGGHLEFRPVQSAGGAAAATLGSLSVLGKVNYLRVGKGAGASAALTISSFSIVRDAVCVIVPQSGAAALGVTEKIFVTSGLPAMKNGKLDGRFMVLDKSVLPYRLTWAAYDATDGFKAVEPVYSKGTAGGTCNYEINDDPDFAVGAILFAPVTGGTTLKAGTVDFGARPGLVWMDARDTASRWPTINNTTFASTTGMWFLGAQDDQPVESGYPIYSALSVGWTGFTRVYGCRWYAARAMMPATGDLYIFGGEDPWGGDYWQNGTASSMTYHGVGANYALRETQHLHMDSRNGSMWANPYGWRSNGNAGDVHRFPGAFTLAGDTDLQFTQARAGIAFCGPIDGAGHFTVLGLARETGFVEVNGANATTGDWELRSATLRLSDEGTLGAGTIWLYDGMLDLNYLTNRAHAVTGTVLPGSLHRSVADTGVATLRYSSTYKLFPCDAVFSGDQRYKATEMLGGGRIGVGSGVSFGTFSEFRGMPYEVYPVVADARFNVSNDTDVVFSGVFTNGTAGTSLTLHKEGTGTFALRRGASSLDRLEVRKGTVKLETPDFWESSDIAWWLDATEASTLQQDGDGAVTNWLSKTGNGVAFKTLTSYLKPTMSTLSVGGVDKPVVAFDWDHVTTKLATALACTDRRTTQATVFIVTVPHKNMETDTGYNHVFGRYNTSSDNEGGEFGLRLWPSNAGTSIDAEGKTGTTFFSNQNGYRINGVFKSGNSKYTNNQPNVICAIRDNEVFPAASDRWASPRFRPQLGSYFGYNSSRGYKGDYCEVIAFNRVLTEDEIKYVENYLYAKWVDPSATLHAGVTKPLGVARHFRNAPALDVSKGAAFDLAGRDVTVADVTGLGSIVNSSDTPATLTVTGNYGFRGTLGAGVTLANAGGHVAAKPALTAPPSEGLRYWLDASQRETILTNAAGGVTGWTSRVTSPIRGFYKPASGNYANASGFYDATGLVGKPALVFPYNAYTRLNADAACLSRTFFFVFKNNQNGDKTKDRYEGFFGLAGVDSGIRYYDATLSAFQMTAANFTVNGDFYRLNGVQSTSDRMNMTDGGQVLTLQLAGDARAPTTTGYRSWEWLQNNKESLGSYADKGSAGVAVSEVIAYDYVLPADEVAAVEQYLTAKWITPAVLPAEPTEVFTQATTLAVGADDTGTLTPFVIDGDQDLSRITLDLSGIALTRADGAKKVLTVTGTATGDLAGAILPLKCNLEKRSDGYYVSALSGTSIIFR